MHFITFSPYLNPSTVLDMLILLPILPILFLTQVRWRIVFDELYDGKFAHSMSLSFRLYSVVLCSFTILIADIVMTPFLLIIALTVYRFQPARVGYMFPVRYMIGSEWHLDVIISFILIIHDVCKVHNMDLKCKLKSKVLL